MENFNAEPEPIAADSEEQLQDKIDKEGKGTEE